MHQFQYVLDHETYIFNLSEANKKGQPDWFREYSARSAYNMASLFPADWHHLITQFDNSTLFDVFFRSVHFFIHFIAVLINNGIYYHQNVVMWQFDSFPFSGRELDCVHVSCRYRGKLMDDPASCDANCRSSTICALRTGRSGDLHKCQTLDLSQPWLAKLC